MARYTLEEIKNFGFTPAPDDAGAYEFVFDKKDYFNSDFLYTEQDGDNYKIVHYNQGENKELQNWEVQGLVGNFRF